jgi:Xaa-Pro aminopeptidase
MIEQRINKIKLKLKPGQAYFAFSYENPVSAVDTFYLSGFASSFAGILIGPDFSCYITHDLYFNDVRTKLKGVFDQIINLDSGLSLTLNQLVKKHKILEIKFSENISLKEHKVIKSLKTKKQAVDWLNKMRIIKSAQEIQLIDESCKIALASLEETKNIIKPGVSENEIAAYLEWQMRGRGAEDKAFETIVASGANAATPHAKTSAKKIAPGEMIMIDFGCKYQGYCSDITRTISVGEPSAKLKQVYGVVERAHQSGIEAAKAGSTSGDADLASRKVIEDAGYAKLFNHATGHGIGLEAHELPHVSPGQTAKLKPGMVFTIEPGIYIPGVGGVRIEDCVVICDDGTVRVLGE